MPHCLPQTGRAPMDASDSAPVHMPAPVIVANEGTAFIRQSGGTTPTFHRERYLPRCSSTVIDADTLNMIQVLALHKAIDRTTTATGSAVLLRDLLQPRTDAAEIHARQEALREIAAADALRQALGDAVREFGAMENALYRFFNKGLYALFPYGDFNNARRAAVALAGILSAVPPAASPYLRALSDRLRAYAASSVFRMMAGAMYKTFAGLKARDEVGVMTPKVAFTPRRLTRWALPGPMIAAMPAAADLLGGAVTLSPMLLHLGIAWTAVYAGYSALFKPLRDTDHFIDPLRVRCTVDGTFSRAVDAVGMIDALLSSHDYAACLPHATTLPTVTDGDRHAFVAKGLKNPVLAAMRPDVVANDVTLDGARLTFLSGPNSGGKTTICKSIVHNQLLAQMGAAVLAEDAAMTVADVISYQAPQFDALQDDEGRFGTELRRTRDIFFSSSPKSLVILDELAEGTTYEERLEQSCGILSDFHAIGGNTVLVTHNHSLVDRFVEDGKGQCLMAAFEGDAPTYRIVPGISRESHARRVARKIGFSDADRRRHLKEKGYV